MNELTDILSQATQKIDGNYFSLPRYDDNNSLRERHYCYELYHQMRLLWPSKCEYFLSGEIDKRSHNFIGTLIGYNVIPDFLIHVPGQMNNNTIIEVKTSELSSKGIEKDLKNLSVFIEKIEYKRAIFLIFGNDISNETLTIITEKYKFLKESGCNLQKIEIWFHNTCGHKATCVSILE
ncbi:hypothetical protein IBT47_26730 [Erwinia sp. S43]|uniref:hypothetical protein n=1 Tax=Erwinia sp. S43 TaxID=2769339 RepID=UPI00190DD971|nr:hypothetical protein [Erwinia sp. S43]MBK0035868.1 hypothetical protein [Erwinia sp. S43]